MKKRIAYINCICFFVILFSCAFFTFIKGESEFSENENRYLRQYPLLDVDQFLQGDYQDDFELALTDQFIGRDIWASSQSYYEEFIGKVENNGIYFGREDYLIDRFSFYDEDRLNTNLNQLNQFANHKDIPIMLMLVPNSSTILESYLPYIHNDVDIDKLNKRIQKQLNDDITFIDPSDKLRNHQDEGVYFKSDHHWNMKGAYYGYVTLREQMGLSIPKQPEFIEVSDEFIGTSASLSHRFYGSNDKIYRINNEVKVKVVADGKDYDDIYFKDHLKRKDKYSYYLNGSMANVHIEIDHDKKDNLLIIRDSYANIMIPYLLDDYASIDVVDLRYDRSSMSELIEKYEIDQVLFLYSTKNFVSDQNLIFLK